MKYIKFILGFFFIYLFFVFPLIGRPLLIDEITMAAFAKVPWSFANLGPAGHPPFYVDSLRLISQVFGIHNGGFRLIGIICFLLNLILIYQLSQLLSKDRKIGLLACLVFTLHPLAIQGSMLLDIDNTVLTVLLTLTVFYFIKNSRTLNLRTGIFLTSLLFLCLWAKLSTPFILMGSLILFHIFKREKKKVIQIFFISIAAILAFLLVWKIDSVVFNFPFSVAFGRSFSVVTKGLQLGSLSAIQKLALRILRVTLWLGPYLVLFWAVNIIERSREIIIKKEQLNFNDLLIIYSVCVFISYILIGGTLFSFAKYQYPMLPILSIIIANAVVSLDLKNFKRHLILYGLLGLVFLFISNVFCGDLLYQVNYVLRKIAIFSPDQLPDFYKDFAKRMIFYFLPFILGIFIIRLLTKKESWFRIFSFLLITFIIMSNFSFNLYLRGTKYFTTYCYGRDIGEFRRVAKFCKDIVEKDKNAKIIAPEDVLEYAGIGIFLGYEELWDDRDNFLNVIKDKRVQVVIYNFAYNALFSYKEIFFNSEVQTELKNSYKLISFKEHSVWLRK